MKSAENGRRSWRKAVSVAALATSTFALIGCGGTDVEQTQTAAGASAQPTAPAGPRIGAAGSACEMPVAFVLAESWKPKAVSVAPDNPLAELARRGPVTMVCEIDAKPAGDIGFLRVWTGDRGTLRTSLEGFIGADAREPVFTELRIGDRPALEVQYQEKSQLDETMDQERAFVVETAQGIVVVSLDSLDTAEHQSMLPAYELARSSLTVTG